MKKTDSGKKRVIVAMSGGVDSAVAAALLKEQGFDVVGLFLHFWSEPGIGKRENACCSLEAQADARRSAKKLGIPLYTANVAKEFKQSVVDYFIDEYSKGNTPNPCAVCNQAIKFQTLFKKMLELKADFVATGHYARIKKQRTGGRVCLGLWRGVDPDKDQSYFLYHLNQAQLKRVLFPVGEYHKGDVRKLAAKYGLTVSNKPESQDVCFVSDSVATFLGRQLKCKPGNIVNIQGDILGKHRGLPLYTIGQRKGLCIGGPGPYYVVGKNQRKNELVVADKLESGSLFSGHCRVRNVRWVNNSQTLNRKVWIETRYHCRPACGIIRKKHQNEVEIVFDASQRSVVAGQMAVFYTKSGRILGGGVIQ